MKRRDLLICAAAVGGVSLLPKLSFASARIVTRTFGGSGGSKEFENVIPSSFGVSAGSHVDALFLNGDRYGGNGGTASIEHTLTDGEYWNKFSIQHGSYVDFIKFSSTDGVVVSGGGAGGKSFESPDNIRVLSLSGRSGRFVDYLRIEYLTDFFPSTTEETRVPVLYELLSGAQTIEVFSQQTSRRLDAFKRVIEESIAATGSVSFELGEAAKTGLFKASAGLTHTRKTTEETIQEVEETLINSVRRTLTVENGFLGVLGGHVNIMKTPEGTRWLLPMDEAVWSVIPLTAVERLTGSISLSPNDRLVTGLNSMEKHGYRFLTAN